MEDEKRTLSILEHILPQILLHKTLHQRPFILGITGLQGSGKSYLASALSKTLISKYDYNTIEVSLDDFYLPHSEQLALREAHPSYDLLKNRGQPATHDTSLAKDFFEQFVQGADGSESSNEEADIWIPSFDKSKYDGDGDRLPRDDWRNISKARPVDIIIFEGWSIGFRSLPPSLVQRKWELAKESLKAAVLGSESGNLGIEAEFSTTTLADHYLEELLFINSNLEQYCHDFMGPQYFDFMVHLDTKNLVNVYTWRLQQERALRDKTGTGMSDHGVVNFVKRYMPAYELYLGTLRRGFFRGNDAPAKQDAHLHVVLDIQRKIVELSLISNKH